MYSWHGYSELESKSELELVVTILVPKIVELEQAVQVSVLKREKSVWQILSLVPNFEDGCLKSVIPN